MQNTNFVALVLCLLFCAAIFLYDSLFRRVPNILLAIAIVVQFGYLLTLGNGLNGIGWWGALAGFAVGLAFFVPLYALRAMAAGDVKFFAVLGLLLGPTALLPVFLAASVMAGIHAVALYASRSGTVPGLGLAEGRLARCTWYQRMLEKRGNRVGIPYAAYLALAGAWVGAHGAGVMTSFT